MSRPPTITPPPLRQPAATRRITPRVVLICAAVLLTVVLIVAMGYARFRVSNASAIRKLEAEARAKGEPLTLVELQSKYPPIPDEDNAATALLESWREEAPEFWAAFFSGARHLPEQQNKEYDPALPYLGTEARKVPPGEPLSPASLSAAEAFLKAHESRYAQMHQAIQRPRFHFPVNLTDGLGALVPHLKLLKQEVTYFQIAALVAAERNDPAKALSALRDSARVGQLLAEEPMLISQLVRLSCFELTVGGMEQWLSRQPLSADDLEQVRRLLEESNLHGTAQFALMAERAFSLSAFSRDGAAYLAAEGVVNDSTEAESAAESERMMRMGFDLIRITGYLLPDQRLMLETFKKCIPLAGEETPESLAEFDNLFDEFAIKALKFPTKMFSAMLLPALQKVPPKFASYEARRRAALTAIAVELYRLDQEGRLPEQLDNLCPTYLAALPADPFDGQPLRYRKLERGYVVYSVGQDRQDNGGKAQPRGSATDGDVAFTVHR
jgi:hypothetical protein